MRTTRAIERRRDHVRSSLLLLGATLLLASCADETSAPIYSDELQVITPAQDAFDVPVRPVFDWSHPTGVTHFELLLGPSRQSLTPVAEGLTDPPVSLPDQLAPNREYFWQVVGRSGDQEWRSEIWRFVTINPEYVTPTEPHLTLVNLFKAWKARDEVMIDSLLAPEYRYIPSNFEQVDPFDRETELAAISTLFRDPRAITLTVSERREDWVVEESDDPRFPFEDGYWEMGISYLTFGVLWERENGSQTLFRLPSPQEVQACRFLPECSPNTGAVAFVRATWTTSQGLPVYKLAYIESAYHPYTPDARHGSVEEREAAQEDGEGGVPLTRTSWGFLKGMAR